MSGSAVLKINLKRICFIDDSKTSAFVTKKMLKQHGYTVDHFADAESALEALMENDYSLVITDLMISSDGGVNGDDLIRLIRHSGHPVKSAIPIIVVTGTGDQDMLDSLIEVGADKVLQKPLNGESLNQAIQTLIQVEESLPEVDVIEIPEILPESESKLQISSEQILELESQLDNEPKPEKEPKQESSPESQLLSESNESISASSINEYASDLSLEISEVLRAEKAEKVSQDIPVLTSIVEPGKTLHESQSISNEIENLLSAFDQPEPGEIPVSNLPAGPELSTPESDDRQKPKPIEKIHKQTGKSQTKEAKEKAELELKEEPKPVVQKVASKKKTVAAEEENPLLALLDHMDDNSFDGDFRKPSAGMSVKSRLQRFQFNEWVPKAILAIIVLIVVVPALSFWLMTQKVIEVNTYKVDTGPIHSLISVPGRIDSKRKIKVSAREGGQLVKVNIKEGDIITKDQVLAQIDDSEARSNIKRAEARLLSIEEEVALTSKTQERLQRALDVGAVSRQMVEDAEANWKTASAKQSVIEEELKSAELKRDRLKIKAPFDGIVTAVFAQEGQWVSQAEELFTLVDMKQRVVEISVDASDSGSLSVGQTVVLRSGAFDGKEWSEEIIKIGSAAKSENSANVIKVTTSFGKNAPDLRVGQQVDAEIRTSSRADALLLPYELIFNHNGAQTVAVIENGSVVFVPIETGIESFTRIEVTNGLRVGQHVIIPAGIPLEQGMNAISVGAQTF